MGFFNELGKKASDACKMTSDKTNKMAREMKLKSYINENKNRINDVYTEIGKKVYEQFNEGNLSDVEMLVKPELDRIEEYARKIENMNNEIRAINNIKLCKVCAAEIDLNARFCSKCGAEQVEEVVETENTVETVINSEPVHPVEPEPSSNESVTDVEKIQPAENTVNEIIDEQITAENEENTDNK